MVQTRTVGERGDSVRRLRCGRAVRHAGHMPERDLRRAPAGRCQL